MNDDLLMQLAIDEARQALDAGEFPVGCVVAARDRVLARAGRRGSTGTRPSELDHAEMIVLRRLEALETLPARCDLTLATTLEPCLMCYGAILLAGIGRIVYAYEDAMGGGTGCRLSTLAPLYAHRRAQIRAGVRRAEALALFRAFFTDPGHHYWQDSLLARYTLAQSAAGGPG